MKRRLNVLRLLVELLCSVVVAKVIVTMAVPVIAPGVTSDLEAILDVTLLSILVAPFMVWRCAAASAVDSGNQVENPTPNQAKVFLMTAITLLVGLGLTALFAVNAHRVLEEQGLLRFERLAERLTAEFERRVELPFYGLKGARGVYAASKSVERLEFRAYVESRDLPREFPGVLGFGFIQRVLRPDLENFVAAERADDAPDFAVRTSGAAPDLYVVKFIDPLSINHPAWGFDSGSEPVRRAALERAVQTGESTITAPITLLRENKKRRGFLFLVPVYRNGIHPTNPSEREASLAGVVVAPVLSEQIFAKILDGVDGLLDVEVFDGKIPDENNLILHVQGRDVGA